MYVPKHGRFRHYIVTFDVIANCIRRVASPFYLCRIYLNLPPGCLVKEKLFLPHCLTTKFAQKSIVGHKYRLQSDNKAFISTALCKLPN